MFFRVSCDYTFSFCLRQLRFTNVCLPGCTLRPLPYVLGTVQNGAHLVCLILLTRRFFRARGLMLGMVYCEGAGAAAASGAVSSFFFFGARGFFGAFGASS